MKSNSVGRVVRWASDAWWLAVDIVAEMIWPTPNLAEAKRRLQAAPPSVFLGALAPWDGEGCGCTVVKRVGRCGENGVLCRACNLAAAPPDLPAVP